MVFVHGVAGAAAQRFGYLLWYELGHLQYQEKSNLTFEQVFPRARGVLSILLVFDSLETVK